MLEFLSMQLIKNQSTTPFTFFFNLSYCSARLLARFVEVLGSLASPRTPSMSSSPTGPLGRSLGVYLTKNELNIGITGL